MTVPFARGLVTATTSWTELLPPAARAPMFQVTTPAASVPPPVALTNDVFAGIVSAITTPVAFWLPVFEYEIVYVMLLPALTGSGPSALLMFNVGLAETVVVSSTPAVGAVSLLSML